MSLIILCTENLKFGTNECSHFPIHINDNISYTFFLLHSFLLFFHSNILYFLILLTSHNPVSVWQDSLTLYSNVLLYSLSNNTYHLMDKREVELLSGDKPCKIHLLDVLEIHLLPFVNRSGFCFLKLCIIIQ
jgi:hypothetical protein